MKKEENICIAPHCEETILLVNRGCPFCTEHITKFDDFVSRHKVSSELDNMLENDEEFRNEFWTDMVNYFFVEEIEEWHKNKPKKNNEQKNKERRRKDERRQNNKLIKK